MNNERITLTMKEQKINNIMVKLISDEIKIREAMRLTGLSERQIYRKKKAYKENGISSLDWNCLTNDSDGANTKQAIMKNLKNTSKGKKSLVILMHDAPNKDLTAETLPDVIKYLREQGYSFKNMYDVIE